MSQEEDIPRRGLLARLVGALAPAAGSQATAPPPAGTQPEPAASATPPRRDSSGGLSQGALREVEDPLAGWKR